MRRKRQLLRKFAGKPIIQDFAREIAVPNAPLVASEAFGAVEGFDLGEAETSFGSPARDDFLPEREFDLVSASSFFGRPASLFMPPQF